MRRFKVSEKSVRAKHNEEDFQTGPKAAVLAWADHCLTKLNVEIARLEDETSKKQKRQRDEQVAMYKRHLEILKAIQEALDCDVIDAGDIENIQEIDRKSVV